MSPDGTKLALIVQGADGQPAAWIRSLDSVEMRKLAGTEGAASLAWSPNSQDLVFGRGGKLNKIDVTGGTPEAICNYSGALYGLAWNQQDVILFSTGPAISRVSASEGKSCH